MKRLVAVILISCITSVLQGQQEDKIENKNKSWYLAWGYTKAYYSRSTIHFKDLSGKYHPATGNNNYYDFTIYNVTAHDRPDLDKVKDVINITIPQFVVHAGYAFNDKWGFELNYDHTKYIVDTYQNARVKGQIFNNPLDKDTILDPDKFLAFEHTDGANFMMFNAVRRWTLWQPHKKFRASFVAKAGGGFVYPRTDVKIFGERLNNNWHVSGWIIGVESGLRCEFLKRGFFELVGKGSYADYILCLVLGKGNGQANHQFFCGQITATLGMKFGVKDKPKAIQK